MCAPQAPQGRGQRPGRHVDCQGVRDDLAAMYWLTTAALIVGLLLAFLTGRKLRKDGR